VLAGDGVSSNARTAGGGPNDDAVTFGVDADEAEESFPK